MAARQKKKDDEVLLSVADVARQYGVSDETVRRWCLKGAIKYKVVGPNRLKRITQAEADKHKRDPETTEA